MAKLNVYGTFEVTTEGDIEGRTTKNLGVYTGFIDEIALHLANKSYYSLSFREIETRTLFPPTLDDVHVSFYDGFSLNTIKKALKDRPVEVSIGQFNRSFVITRELTPIEKKNRSIIKTALSKLTDEEREVLGI